MASTFVNPSSTNVFVPNLDASNRLQVDFVRNTNAFPLPNYVQYGQSEATVGLYSVYALDQEARVINDDASDKSWAPGADRPQFRNTLEDFRLVNYVMIRKSFGYQVDWLTRDQAAWNLTAAQEKKTMMEAMTSRTVVTLKMLTDPANWGTHVIDVTDIPGVTGAWNLSTTARQDIKRSIDWVRLQIALATRSAFDVFEDLIIVMNPYDAASVAESQEMADYLKGSYWSYDRLQEKLPGGAKKGSGAPADLYGVNMIVEDTVRVSSQKGASIQESFAMPRGTAFIMARPGGLDAPPGGGPSFSTCTLLTYKGGDMTVESFDDSVNRKTNYMVTDHFVPLLTAPMSGYLLTGLYSAS